MKRSPTTSLAVLAISSASLANLEQIEPVSELWDTPGFGVMQIFPDLPAYSGTVVEDFVTLGTVTRVSVAFELYDPSIFPTLRERVTGWRVSLWARPEDAAGSGNDLAGNALATVFVPGDSPTLAYGRIATALFRADITGLELTTPPGLVWIGVAPEMKRFGNGQAFILTNVAPENRGGGGARNARGVNPGNGFGMGALVNAPLTDVAYSVTSVPEPAGLLALAAGLGALARRRRRP